LNGVGIGMELIPSEMSLTRKELRRVNIVSLAAAA
jgi:hypothetical protein